MRLILLSLAFLKSRRTLFLEKRRADRKIFSDSEVSSRPRPGSSNRRQFYKEDQDCGTTVDISENIALLNQCAFISKNLLAHTLYDRPHSR
jgi:hypothetical protein